MITVGGRQILNLEDLSERFRRVLVLIPGGLQWFHWAIDPSGRVYSASSETELVVQIQEGLHRTGQVPVPTSDLLVNIGNLMAVSDEDFSVLTAPEESSKSVSKASVLNENRWLTAADIKSATQWLDKLVETLSDADTKERASLIFQVVTLSDQTSMYALSQKSEGNFANSVFQREATQFGVSQTQDPSEFVDAYGFYMASIEKLGLAQDDESDEAREQDISRVWDALLPATNELLNSPSFGIDYQGDELIKQIDRWIAEGNVIGFPTQAGALANIIQFSGIKQSDFTETGDSGALTLSTDGKAAIDLYVQEAMQFIGTTAQAYSNRVSQDGLNRLIEFQTAKEQADLSVNLWGTVTLGMYSKN